MKVYFLREAANEMRELEKTLKRLGHKPRLLESPPELHSPLIVTRAQLEESETETELVEFHGPLVVFLPGGEGLKGMELYFKNTGRMSNMLCASDAGSVEVVLAQARCNHSFFSLARRSYQDSLQHDFIFLRAKGVFHRVEKGKIVLVKSDRVYSEVIFLDGTKMVVRESLARLNALLGQGFIRFNRSTILHLRQVQEVGPDYVKAGIMEIAITRKNRNALLKQFNCHEIVL